MRTAVAVIILVCLVIGFCVPTAGAQDQDNITITTDGTVIPSTAAIQQETGIYTLTGDFQGSILIEKSGIVLNGAGHSVYSSERSQYGVRLLNVANVTIKNMTVKGADFGYIRGVELVDCTDCTIINSNITDVWSFLGLNGILYVGVYVSGGGSNTITKNSLVNNSLGMYFLNSIDNVVTENSIDYVSHSVNSHPSGIAFDNASGNAIYHNNFRAEVGGQANTYKSSNNWDDGYPSGGNFWSDYRSRYLNATVIDDSGAGNVAYVVGDQNVDNYPLMEPFNATAQASPSPTPGGSATAGPNANAAIDFTVVGVAVAVIVVVLAIAALAVYFRRRHR